MSRGLHVLFLGGGNGLAAQLAAHLTRVLAGGHLQVDAADCAHMDLTAALDHAQPRLVVVIHTPDEPGPMALHNHGGRVDWHLEIDAVTVAPVELASQLRWHAMRLLSDLGISQTCAEAHAKQPAVPSLVLELPVSLPDSAFRHGKTHALAA
jgi:hypothetical protein